MYVHIESTFMMKIAGHRGQFSGYEWFIGFHFKGFLALFTITVGICIIT